MAGRGPRSAIERAEIGNSRPTVVRACALLDQAGALTTKFGVERTVFFQKISDDLLLMAIDPAGDHGDEDVQNHGNSWDGEYRRAHSTEYTVNPRDFNGVASADFFNTTG